jgi:hypothetical protein
MKPTTAFDISVDASRIETPGLDPITLIIEDISPGRGRIIVECFGQAWSAYWGGLAGRNVVEFLRLSDPHYLAGCLRSGVTYKMKPSDDQYLLRIAGAVIDHCKQQ